MSASTDCWAETEDPEDDEKMISAVEVRIIVADITLAVDEAFE